MPTPSVAAAPPRPSRSFDLSTLLLALPALSVVPLLLLAALLLALLARQSQDEAWRALAAEARTLALDVEHDLASAARVLALLSDAPVLQAEPPDLARFDAYARRAIGPTFRLASLAIVDRDGHQLLDTARAADDREQPRLVPLTASEREAFTRGQPVISPLEARPEGGGLALSITVPVVRAGRTQWALSARLGADYFAERLAAQAARTGQVAALLDAEQRMIARSRDTRAFFGRQASPAAATALAATPAGTIELASFDGEPLLWGWQRLASGWTAVVGVPAAPYRAQLAASMTRLAAAGLVALAIGVAAAALLGRRIGRSVAALDAGAPRLLEGRAAPYRWSGVRQLDRLYHTLAAAGARLAAALAERSHALEDKRAALEQAQQAHRAERTARAEAESANRSKDEFLAMLSHELRNPLAPIVNMARLLARAEPLTERGQGALAVIARQAEHLARLVDDLMEATRVTKGLITLQPVAVDVARAVTEAVEAARAAAADAPRRISVVAAPALGSVEADPVRLRQVLGNLLANALKYSRVGDPIEVEATGDAIGVEIRVRDAGIGIEAADLARIFGLFVQADATIDRAAGGLGIGLAMVRALVQMHGGSVHAESAGKGRGATFVVRLPRVARPAASSRLAPQPAPPSAPRRRIGDQPDAGSHTPAAGPRAPGPQ